MAISSLHAKNVRNLSETRFMFHNCMFIWSLQGIEMAKLLESHIKREPHFEVPAKRHLGLVVFCLKVQTRLHRNTIFY